MVPRTLLLLALIIGACEPSPPPGDIQRDEPIGQLEYAIDSDVQKISYGEVRCTPDGDAVMVELVSNRVVRGPQGVGQRPRVLIARLQGDEVLEAQAFAYGVVHDGISYTMLQLVAKDVVGAEPAECRVEHDADSTTLVCNQTSVVGWRGSGPPPRPSFKVKWKRASCEAAAGR
jgi:hypothetical protein